MSGQGVGSGQGVAGRTGSGRGVGVRTGNIRGWFRTGVVVVRTGSSSQDREWVNIVVGGMDGWGGDERIVVVGKCVGQQCQLGLVMHLQQSDQGLFGVLPSLLPTLPRILPLSPN
jgi:hypothetical protein